MKKPCWARKSKFVDMRPKISFSFAWKNLFLFSTFNGFCLQFVHLWFIAFEDIQFFSHIKPINRRSKKLFHLFILLLIFRVYKKTSSNQLLTLYLGTRELVSRAGVVDPIKGIIYVDPKIVESNQKVYCQLTLTFRWEYILI